MTDVPPASTPQSDDWSRPEAARLLSDAWDRSQQMVLDASKQAALLATILLGFEAHLSRAATTLPTIGKAAAILFVLSIMACAAMICANALQQQKHLYALTHGISRPPSLIEGIRLTTGRRNWPIALGIVQVLLIAAGITLFAIQLM